jgi:hypothetical protein
MDPSARSERAEPLDAEAFVRFCYRRRRVGWPDLYDEMCRVAHRGSFHGMGLRDLAEIGIGFSLQETADLAARVTRVVAEEQAARARSVAQSIVIRSTVADRIDPESDRILPLAVAAGA